MRLILLILPVLLSSCALLKNPLKDAKTFENSGMYSQSYDEYRRRYEERGDAEALVGMRRTAQVLINIEFEKGYSLYLRGQLDEAREQFDQAEKWRREMEYYRLNLNVDPKFQVAYSDIDNVQFEWYYKEAETLLLAADFERADIVIDKLRSLRRNDPRVGYLETMSIIYPAYLEGKKAMELGLYRNAYESFSRVCSIDSGFKDALALRNEAKAKLSYTLAYMSVNKDEFPALEATISSRIKQNILALNDPFITLVERDDIWQILEEQKLGMGAGMDEETVTQAGKLIGAQYLVTGEILAYDDVLSNLHIEERQGYLGSTTKSKKVKYEEVSQSRRTTAVFRYQIINAETGVVHASETLPFELHDEVRYALFSGEDGDLYPGVWTSKLIPMRSDKVYGWDEKQELDKLLNAPRTPRTGKLLEQEVIDNIASSVAQKVSDFRPPFKQ
jgi:tetratricopeptide (TPR) repeat protein